MRSEYVRNENKYTSARSIIQIETEGWVGWGGSTGDTYSEQIDRGRRSGWGGVGWGGVGMGLSLLYTDWWRAMAIKRGGESRSWRVGAGSGEREAWSGRRTRGEHDIDRRGSTADCRPPTAKYRSTSPRRCSCFFVGQKPTRPVIVKIAPFISALRNKLLHKKCTTRTYPHSIRSRLFFVFFLYWNRKLLRITIFYCCDRRSGGVCFDDK